MQYSSYKAVRSSFVLNSTNLAHESKKFVKRVNESADLAWWCSDGGTRSAVNHKNARWSFAFRKLGGRTRPERWFIHVFLARAQRAYHAVHRRDLVHSAFAKCTSSLPIPGREEQIPSSPRLATEIRRTSGNPWITRSNDVSLVTDVKCLRRDGFVALKDKGESSGIPCAFRFAQLHGTRTRLFTIP